MRGKLIKHEFKDTMRLVLPMCGFIAVLTPIFSLMMSLGNNYDEDAGAARSVVFGSGIAGYFLLLFGLIIITQILIVMRFYRTMASTEAYLTFTLPAKPGQIIFAKWLVAMIWYIISCIVAIVSILIVLLIATPITFQNIGYALSKLYEFIDFSNLLTILLLGLFAFISLSVSILQMYASVMIGQLARTHRVALSIGVYLGLSQGVQIVLAILSIPFVLIFPEIESENIILLLCCLIYGILSAAYYITTYLLTVKKLNVK